MKTEKLYQKMDAKKYLKENSKCDVVHQTSDGSLFYTKGDAVNHGKTLDDIRVDTYHQEKKIHDEEPSESFEHKITAEDLAANPDLEDHGIKEGVPGTEEKMTEVPGKGIQLEPKQLPPVVEKVLVPKAPTAAAPKKAATTAKKSAPKKSAPMII